MGRPVISVIVLAGLVASLWAAGVGAQEAYRQVTVTNGATISGEAIFAGPPPGPFVIWVKKDAEVFGEKVPDDRLVVSQAGKIKNVVVTLEGITEGKPWPDGRPQLANKGGRFLPHVQIVRRDVQLEIVNRDPVLHNTHGYQGGRTVFNLAQPNQNQIIKRPLKQPGLIDVMCDAHDWMSGWIVVSAHPYVAITGDDGTYAIPDVPPGAYTLTAWHEKLGKKQVQVTVGAGKRQRVDFTFSPK
ncbi:MAG: carboxypeptidase regulatory-like domain-containing protein [Candidatus Rokubacteria bacterium]|nr:carboxypeptidase regulatory-like domain-containing protein [Candidatus Rokubacteria bacterium]